MTPGVTTETVDGMSLAKIDNIIAVIRQEKYRWMPVRREYIEKKNSSKKRPLGLPTWSDKLLQEVIRSILEAYYFGKVRIPIGRVCAKTKRMSQRKSRQQSIGSGDFHWKRLKNWTSAWRGSFGCMRGRCEAEHGMAAATG